MDRLIPELDSKPFRLLLVDDSQAEADLTLKRLTEAGFECSYRRVANTLDMRSGPGH